MLKKPFFAYEPGEQRSLNYNLPVDKQDYRFGKAMSEEQVSVKECMRFENMNPEKSTKMVSRQVQDFVMKGKDLLGESRTNKWCN